MNALVTPIKDTGLLVLRIETDEYVFEEYELE